jgi:hypothetical protein
LWLTSKLFIAEYKETFNQYYYGDAGDASGGSNIKSSKGTKVKSSDEDLKRHAANLPVGLMSKCNPRTCKFQGKCVSQTTLEDLELMRNDFWGDYGGAAPSTSVRRINLVQICRAAYRPSSDSFEFMAGQRRFNNRLLCEAGFLILLGLSNSPNASDACGQWHRAKKYVREGKDLIAQVEDCGIKFSDMDIGIDKGEKKRNKLNHARAFIMYYTKSFGDTIPSADGKHHMCCNVCGDVLL